MSIPDTTPIYVFGCFGFPGHYLRTATKGRVGSALWGVEAACDWSPDVRWRSRADAEQAEGALHGTQPPPGWSIVAWWDRQGDERHGSHTAIAAPGTWTDAELLEAARARTPWAFRVEVRSAS